ncbi:MAG: hypothetical protein R2854_29350 [Caldilineaceae bacterium]
MRWPLKSLRCKPRPRHRSRRIYRRLGKLYEQRSQRQALTTPQAGRAEGTDVDGGEFVELLKDRAWVQIERGDFAAAHADLVQAQTLAPQAASAIQADIHDAGRPPLLLP